MSKTRAQNLHTPAEHMQNPSAGPSVPQHKHVIAALETVHETRYTGVLIKYVQNCQFCLKPKPYTLHEIELTLLPYA